jgi:hypothetical protein
MADGEVRVEIRATSDQFDAALRRSEKQAHKFDKAVTATTNNAVNNINKKLAQSSKQTESFSNATASANTNVARFGRSAGMASIQVQQFIGQVSGGVSPLIAMSQQAADLGIVLGAPLIGSVVGIAAAIGTMLVPRIKLES